MTETQLPEPHSLESLFRGYGKQVFRAAYRVTGSTSDAEDAVQTVFERLARNEHLEKLGHHPGPYLMRAGTNAALDLVRRRTRTTTVDFDDEAEALVADPRDEPDRQLANVDLSGALRRALSTLSERSAEIFSMRYLEGMKNPAIAAELGTSPGVVAVTLHRARRTLIQEMKSYLGERHE